jgi:hypothetical protein
VTLASRADREARIAKATAASAKNEEFYDFRGARVALPVVRLPVEVPLYRMENFRTYSEQAEYCAREKVARELFLYGQENEAAQQIQHDILAQLARKGKARSVVPVIEVLERDGQRESLLVTTSGVVVNGNRRLAAMRELYSRDSGTFASFGFVDCKVLPADTTPADILQIEAILQAKPETRLDYDWIGDAQLLSAMTELLGSVEAVAQNLNRKKAEVQNALQALAEADLYLKDWVGAPGQYNRVAQLAGKPAVLAEASRAIAWTLFENGSKLDGRLYGYNAAFGKRAEDVLDRLSDDLGISLTKAVKETEEGYDFEIDEDGATANYSPLIAQLKDPETKTAAVDALIEICTSVVESEKDRKSGNAALKAVTAAHTRLVEVDLSRAAPETYQSIARQLEAITERAKVLRAQMDSIFDAKSKSANGASPS